MCIIIRLCLWLSHIYNVIDYKRALMEYSLVGGQIPLPPRYAFGVFYSRYWAYNDIGEMVIPDIQSRMHTSIQYD